METVNKVVDAGYKAIWGEGEQTANEQTTASSSQPAASTGVTGIPAVDKVVGVGKKVIWGEDAAEKTQETSQVHSEEPVSGKMGLGTATDPYDAGNRDDQYEAPPVEAAGLPTSMPISEQRDIEKAESNLNSSGSGKDSAVAAAASQDLKPSSTGLRLDPAQPGNDADSRSRVIPDGGPGQTLKHTSEPFEKETDKLAKDLQEVNIDDNKPQVHTVNGGIAVSQPNQIVDSNKTDLPEEGDTKAKVDSKESSVSSSSSAPSSSGAGDSQDSKQGQKTKTSKLEKVKNKLHIGSHSHKSSR